MVSGYVGEIDPQQVEKIGIRRVLSKPLTAREFADSLEELVGGRLSVGNG